MADAWPLELLAARFMQVGLAKIKLLAHDIEQVSWPLVLCVVAIARERSRQL